MSHIPLLNVGADGDPLDVSKINAALATIRAIVNGDIDNTNIENGAVTALKIASSVFTRIVVSLFGAAPSYDGASLGYPIATVDNFQNDMASFEVLKDSTIRAVAYRRLSTTSPGVGLFEACLFINGVSADPTTGKQAATLYTDVPIITGDPGMQTGLNIPVSAGSKLSLRANVTGAGTMAVAELPLECLVYLDVPLV
jgi:hypothetical protein